MDIKKLGSFYSSLPNVKGFMGPNYFTVNPFWNKQSDKSYTELRKRADKGLSAAEKNLSSPGSLKQASGYTQKFTQEVQKNYQMNSQISSNKIGDLTKTTQKYQISGGETIKTAFTNEGVLKQSTAKGSQITQLNEQKNSFTDIGLQLNKTINSTLGIKTYGNAQQSIKVYDYASQAAQQSDKQVQTQATSDVTKDVFVFDAKGNQVGENYLHRVGEVDTATTIGQQADSQEQKKTVVETNASREKVGDVSVSSTQTLTQSIRQGESQVVTESQTNTVAKSVDLNKAGDIIAQRSSQQQVEGQNVQQTQFEETSQGQKETMLIQQGQNSLTLEKSQGFQELIQTTLGKASQVISQLDAAGNVTSQRNTEVDSSSTVDRTIATENERMIARSANAVSGMGAYTENTLTDITSKSQVVGGAAAQSDRQIETQKSIDWNGSIQIDQAQAGAKAYSISNVEITNVVTQDVTKSGKNEVAVNTATETGKTVSGTVEAKLDQVQPVQNAPKATIAVNFATYTGLGAGFKMDSGEVSFNLQFSSAELTRQQTVRESGDTTISQTQTNSGQINDASLVGTLRSFTTDDGKRVIEVSASYVKDGSKFANDQAGVAVAGADTNVEIKGSMVIEGDRQSKSIQSEFQMYKKENIEASGTSQTALNSAVDISDPLRKSFTFDKGIFSFQLGFASMNIAVYA